ncbi:MAG: heavy-metal-associated domain-containing protein [Bacilli bacterium]
MEKTILIEGMSCQHCVKRVEKALANIGGVDAKVSLEQKLAKVNFKKDIKDQLIIDTINDLGYKVTSIK